MQNLRSMLQQCGVAGVNVTRSHCRLHACRLDACGPSRVIVAADGDPCRAVGLCDCGNPGLLGTVNGVLPQAPGFHPLRWALSQHLGCTTACMVGLAYWAMVC